ncbi:MAG: hypothetical protein U5M50_08545 [Sphingobium sp.]|nr:hypothetical protein [Sphingobium sp.]
MIDVAKSVIDGPLNGCGQAIIKAIYDKDTAHYNDAGRIWQCPALSRAEHILCGSTLARAGSSP